MNNLTMTYAIHIVAVDFLPSVWCPMDSFVFSHTLWIAQVLLVRFFAFLCAIGAICNMVLTIMKHSSAYNSSILTPMHCRTD